MNICIEPGCEEKTRGVRCAPHNRELTPLTWARLYDAQDRELLADVQSGLTISRLAVRANVSRTMIYKRIAKARRRQALLNRQVLPDTI